MWLPRLRFTLVPRSSRSPFQRGLVHFFSSLVRWGGGRGLLIFQHKGSAPPLFQSSTASEGSFGGISPFSFQYLIRTRSPRSDQKESDSPQSALCELGTPSASPVWAAPQRVHPLPRAGPCRGTGCVPNTRDVLRGVVGSHKGSGALPAPKEKKSFVIGLIKTKPDLSFLGCFFFFLHKRSF